MANQNALKRMLEWERELKKNPQLGTAIRAGTGGGHKALDYMVNNPTSKISGSVGGSGSRSGSRAPQQVAPQQAPQFDMDSIIGSMRGMQEDYSNQMMQQNQALQQQFADFQSQIQQQEEARRRAEEERQRQAELKNNYNEANQISNSSYGGAKQTGVDGTYDPNYNKAKINNGGVANTSSGKQQAVSRYLAKDMWKDK